ncbi:MAG: FkbM family methyltransferase [Smithella sp.]|jgi:FkbM family methyltransferase
MHFIRLCKNAPASFKALDEKKKTIIGEIMEIQYDKKLDAYFRNGSLDRCIFDQIQNADEYLLKEENFTSSDIALDIGGHIGFFARAILKRGIGHVYLYEISPQNIELCKKNLQKYLNQVTINHLAVWNKTGQTLYFDEFPNWGNDVNTGGCDVFSGGKIAVQTISFDQIITEITDHGKKRIKILKIDAEGSEWPILLQSQTLDQVDMIVGELHEYGGQYDNLSPGSVGLPDYKKLTRLEFEDLMISHKFKLKLNRNHSSRYIPFKATR